MTWSWLFGDFERDDSVEGVPRGGIVWLKERCYIQDDIWQRYEVSGDVLNHPVLIVDTPETDGQLKDNERRILTLTTLNGQDAETYRRGQWKSYLLPIVPITPHNGAEMLHLTHGRVLRKNGYVFLRDAYVIDHTMLKDCNGDDSLALTRDSLDIVLARLARIVAQKQEAAAAAAQTNESSAALPTQDATTGLESETKAADSGQALP